MNRLVIYRRYFWELFFLSTQLVVCVYLLAWSTIFFGGYLPQEVCDVATFTGTVDDLPAPSASEFAPEILATPYDLQDHRDDLVFQHQYALLSPRPEFQNLAPVIEKSIARLDAFNPSFLDWSHKLTHFEQDLQTHHVIFTRHFNACLAFPKERPPHFIRRVGLPLPEAFSILRGYFGPSHIPYYAHPTYLQVYRHLERQYGIFRQSFTADLKALRSHPGTTQFNASSPAIAAALQDLRAHTTGKRNTLHLLHQNIMANPHQATRTLESLGGQWSVLGPRRLAQQADILNAIDHDLTNAAAYIRKVTPYIVRTESEALELDACFARLTPEDVFQGRGAANIMRFKTQLKEVLLLPEKAGITEAGWERIRERAERSLGLWGDGEERMKTEKLLHQDGAEANEARNEREL